eukprot:TRINITY_DN833_c0_g1_i1.p1 TRINITY_DN833_c0_g1~~TRINITY_DN833_c0_g1_i1.p1  ORF type:complete len:156 (+),score=27.99 TRINITY_DN833_c0_g1_i1:30-497(+)
MGEVGVEGGDSLLYSCSDDNTVRCTDHSTLPAEEHRTGPPEEVVVEDVRKRKADAEPTSNTKRTKHDELAASARLWHEQFKAFNKQPCDISTPTAVSPQDALRHLAESQLNRCTGLDAYKLDGRGSHCGAFTYTEPCSPGSCRRCGQCVRPAVTA